ncbi:hypothetical protein CXG46_05450 [Nocardioides alpinus]|uniref:Uncharacterized protein n=1 Tax=Nocardioides alpinus TaxID=748909 RepID=A0ABX4QZJ2_9ACTN|nr:hypothetical protein CXG46_05450 [Nocardioides alpinus]
MRPRRPRGRPSAPQRPRGRAPRPRLRPRHRGAGTTRCGCLASTRSSWRRPVSGRGHLQCS